MMHPSLRKKAAAIAAAASLMSPLSTARAETLVNGAGASLPYPIYSKWFDEYQRANPGVRFNYQAIGSGGGIRQFTARTVAFGATDAPMTEKEIAQVKRDFHHIPTVLGAVVPAYNLPGISNVNFTGEILAKIYLGEITTWNDKALVAINPGVPLPQKDIIVIRRADGSGTTYCFTDFLSESSADWKRRVGRNVSVNWPVGIGGKGNEGVAGLVKRTPSSLGYLELMFARQNNIPFGSVKNREGKFVRADVESVSAAANTVQMPQDFRVSIVNAPGEASYPISTFTWLLIDKNNEGGTGPVLKAVLSWMLSEGQAMAPKLDYAPLPDSVAKMAKEAIETIQ